MTRKERLAFKDDKSIDWSLDETKKGLHRVVIH